MVLLLVVAAFVLAALMLSFAYKRASISTAEVEKRKSTNGSPDSTGTCNTSDSEESSKISKYLQPSVISGRIRRNLSKGKTFARSNKSWPGDNIGQPMAHESVVLTQKKLDDFLSKKEVARVLSPMEMKRLVESTEDTCQPLVLTACYTGMTACELLGLLWQDMDFDRCKIHVRRIYQDGRFYETARDVAKRSVVVPQAVIDILKAHREQQEKKHIKTQYYFVFTNAVGEALGQQTLRNRIFGLAARKAGIMDLKFEDLRYSYVSALMNAGETLEFIKGQLGYPKDGTQAEERNISLEAEKEISERLARAFNIATPENKAA